MPTTGGTTAPGADLSACGSAAAARLRAAGAILIGKTAHARISPGARSRRRRATPGTSRAFPAAPAAARGRRSRPACARPRWARTPGGSIRIPASFCGVVGLKPTFGRISRDGIVPHSWSLDHAGPLTRTVADAALLLGVLAGPDPADPATAAAPVPDYLAATRDASARGLRVGGGPQPLLRPQSARRSTRRSSDAIALVRRRGRAVRDVHVPDLRIRARRHLRHRAGLLRRLPRRGARTGRVAALRRGRARGWCEMGRLVTGADLLKAEQFRRVLIGRFRRACCGGRRDPRPDRAGDRAARSAAASRSLGGGGERARGDLAADLSRTT